jgi:hypothetical protein
VEGDRLTALTHSSADNQIAGALFALIDVFAQLSVVFEL